MNNNRNLREVETSPDGRYVRFDEKLGNGAYKEVFLAYDTETGKEVAWNTVTLARLPQTEKKRIRMETEILRELDHPHIINFYHVWENKDKDQICFTTEIVTSGTLKQYVHRVRNVKLKVIKKWCRQILTALDYLHCHAPPIIHRDLKCDNIFINGGTGEIRIGDFGLSAARHTTHVESVLGTPEFMAPELYDENYSEKVDIYAFGMCVLEMTTKEYPYEECSNAAQIWKKVSMGQKPEVLTRILTHEVRAFIEICLMPADVRLSARELLKHPFLKFKRSDPSRDNITVQVEPRASPTHREGKAEQQEKLKQGLEARAAEKERDKLYNQSSTNVQSSQAQQRQMHNADGGEIMTSPTNNDLLYHPHPSPSPTPVAGQPHHPPHINTQTPTHQGVPTALTSEYGHEQQPHHTPLDHHHPPHNLHHQPSAYESQLHQQQYSQQPNSAQTPPARFSRQASLPNLVAMGGPLTHSQSTHSNLGSNLQHPQPQRTHQLEQPNLRSANPSPDLIHVASVVVDVESTHDHFVNIALHIHFEAGTRRKKQIRFVFDFYRDTSDSIAHEMVKALKLPDQERTARLIAHNMELKIDPLRREYYQQHGATSTKSSTDSTTVVPNQRPPSPAISPASKSRALPPTTKGGPHDERHPPPHPMAAVGAGGNKGGSTPTGGTGGGHYSTLPSPQSSQQPTPKVAGQQYHTMPTQGGGGAVGGHHPKLNSAQPTNVTGQPPRPQAQPTPTGKPPHPGQQPPPGAQRTNSLSPGTNETAQQVKSLANRRHSHDPNATPPSHEPVVVTRTTSIPHSLAHYGSMPTQQISPIQPGMAGLHVSPNPPSNNNNANSLSGLRRSSSTSSLAFMVTPDESAQKHHHDRLYDEYKSYNISTLKEKIKERMREKNRQASKDGPNEAVELNGILEKNDLIESLIRLTPKTNTTTTPTFSSHPPQPPSATSSYHGHSPPSPHEGASRFDVAYMDHAPSDTSSQQSTPRITPLDGSDLNTPAELRSRTHSIDASENALLGHFGTMSMNKNGSKRSSAEPSAQHSPNISPVTSPAPSPSGHSLQERKQQQQYQQQFESDSNDHPVGSLAHHPGPSSHRISQDYVNPNYSHNFGTQVLGPTPLIRSTTAPCINNSELPDLGRSGKKLFQRDTNSIDTAPAAAGRNFNFPQPSASASGNNSPASTSSNASVYTDELSGSAHLQPTTVPSALHVDVNPLSPPTSAPTSAEIQAISPALKSGGNLFPPPMPMVSIPHNLSLTPQSPTIPEETGNENEEVDSNSVRLSPILPPAFSKHLSMPLTGSGSSHSNRHSLPSMASLSHRTPQPSMESGMNQPLAHFKKDGQQQYSSSVDDLSRLTGTNNSAAAQMAKGSVTPTGVSTGFVGPAHLRTGSIIETGSMMGSSSHSASSTPAARTNQQQPPPHQRANSVFVGSSHELETEAEKKLRLELAERTRLQKKTDAAMQAKACEDKILSGLGNFSLH